MGRFTQGGVVYEELPDGQVRVVGYEDAPVQGAPTAIPLPRSPSQVRETELNIRGKEAGLGNDATRTGLAIQSNARDANNSTVNNTLKLRSDFDAMPGVKEYRIALPQLGLGLKTKPDAAGDNALIYAYAKAMDPGSVVRESEMEMAGKAGSWLETRAAQIKKELGIEGGGQLSPQTRDALRREMVNKVGELNRAYTFQRERYKADATNLGIDPERVIGKHDGQPYHDGAQAWARTQQNNAMLQDVTGGATLNLAGGGDRQQSIPIPREMQAEYEAFVGPRRGQLDPQEYASFRDQLDRKYGFAANTPTQMDTNRKYAADANAQVQQGGQLNMRITPPSAPLDGLQSLNASVFNNPVGAALMSASPLSGGMDEVAGGVRSLINGTDYGVERDRANAMRQTAKEQFPNASMAGEIGGGLLAGAGVAGRLPRLSQAISTVPGMLGSGAAFGAASGALENNADRTRGAAVGAGAGVAGGLVGRYALAPVLEAASRSKAVQGGANRVGKALEALTGKSSRLAGYTPPRLDTAQSVTNNLKPDWERIRASVSDASDLGLPYSLADADPKLRALAGQITRKSVNVRDLAENTFEPRAMNQGKRAVENIDKLLAPITDIAKRKNELYDAGNTASAPFYKMAGQRDNPIPAGMGPVTGSPSGMDREIDAILKTPSGREALSRASRIAGDRRIDPNSIGLTQDESGNYVLRNGASFETLDLAKKGMDANIQDLANPFTGKVDLRGNPTARALDQVRKQLVGRLDEINPAYKQARDAYAPYGQQAEALELGYKGANDALKPRDLDDLISGLDKDRLAEYRRGYATSLSDQAGTVRRTGDPYATIYGDDDQTKKIASLFPEGAGKFQRLYELERDMAKTRGETLGGSQTAGRLQADQQIGQGLEGHAVNAGIDVATGSPSIATGLSALKNMAQNK